VDSPADHPGNESATPLATAVAPCGGVLLGPGEVQDAIKEGWIGAERARRRLMVGQAISWIRYRNNDQS
jgi:hypothetical protein